MHTFRYDSYILSLLSDSSAERSLTRAAFGEGEGDIYLDDVDCKGTETGLSFCESGG